MHAGASKCILDNRKCLSSISTSIFARAFNFICQKYIPPKHTHTHTHRGNGFLNLSFFRKNKKKRYAKSIQYHSKEWKAIQ